LNQFAAPDAGQVFAGQHDLGPTNEGAEEAVQFFGVHGLAGIDAREEGLKPIKLVAGQRLGENLHPWILNGASSMGKARLN
jgi:hypothetical protein